MSKALTVDLIHMKTKTNRIEQIKNLNLWGNDLNDISIVNQMSQLEVLSLSVNQLSTFKDIQFCYNLRELYFRNNLIANMNELRYLQSLSRLRILWMAENPIASYPKYRLAVIALLPQITRLDNQDIGAQEKNQAEQIDVQDILSQQPNFDRAPKQDNKNEPLKPNLRKYNVLLQSNLPLQTVAQQDEYEDNSPLTGKSGGIQRSPPQRRQMEQEYSPPRNQFSPPREMEIGGPPVGGGSKVQHSPRNYQNQPPQEISWLSQQSNENISPQQMPAQYKRAQTNFNQPSPPQFREFDGGNFNQKKKPSREAIRNENILCAIISLMRELDKNGLEFVRKDCEKRLQRMD